MQTKEMPSEFFQLLTEIESNLALVEHQTTNLSAQVDKMCNDHPERNSLMIHHHYLNESIKDIYTARARYGLMRYYFVPKL